MLAFCLLSRICSNLASIMLRVANPTIWVRYVLLSYFQRKTCWYCFWFPRFHGWRRPVRSIIFSVPAPWARCIISCGPGSAWPLADCAPACRERVWSPRLHICSSRTGSRCEHTPWASRCTCFWWNSGVPRSSSSFFGSAHSSWTCSAKCWACAVPTDQPNHAANIDQHRHPKIRSFTVFS